jgi:hypothetical protein
MGITLKKKERIASDFSGTYYNNAYKHIGRNGTITYSISILKAFDIVQQDVTNVYLRIDKDDVLYISYKDCAGNIQTASFNGKYKRGFYEYYLSDKNIQIPPLFPIIYSNIDIEIVRIGKSKSQELIIERFIDRSGSIFFFAVGSSWTSQSFHQSFMENQQL